MSPQTSPTQIPAPQLSKRRQAVLILAPHCSQKKKKKKSKYWNPQNRWQRRHFKHSQIILWVENRSWQASSYWKWIQARAEAAANFSLLNYNQFLPCAHQKEKNPTNIYIGDGKYNLYSYISFVMLNTEDVQNTEEQWLLNLLMNRTIYAKCSHKGYWQGLFSSLLASETIFTNPTSNERLKMSPNRSLKVNKKNFLYQKSAVYADVFSSDIVLNGHPRIR